MTNTEARAEIDRIIALQADDDVVAKLEVLREWMTNADFREALSNWAFYHRKE